MDDKDNLIEALKTANEGKDNFICMLVVGAIKKDGEIDRLQARIEFLEKWARWSKGKSDG